MSKSIYADELSLLNEKIKAIQVLMDVESTDRQREQKLYDMLNLKEYKIRVSDPRLMAKLNRCTKQVVTYEKSGGWGCDTEDKHVIPSRKLEDEVYIEKKHIIKQNTFQPLVDFAFKLIRYKFHTTKYISCFFTDEVFDETSTKRIFNMIWMNTESGNIDESCRRETRITPYTEDNYYLIKFEIE